MSRILLAAALATAIAGPMLAGAAYAQKVTIPTGVFFKGQQAGETLVRGRLIGAKVLDAGGQAIGEIEDVILDKDNKVIGVLVAAGGKQLGVRMAALKIETKDGKTTISLPQATKDVIGALQPYEKAK